MRSGLSLREIGEAVSAALVQLRRSGAQRTAVVGYSMGGAIALWAATVLQIDLAVTVYGGGLRRSYWPNMPAGIDLAGNLIRSGRPGARSGPAESLLTRRRA